MNKHLRGDTVRFIAKFADWDPDVPRDPTSVTVKVFEGNGNREIHSGIGVSSGVVGEYHYDYTIPLTARGLHTVEFCGTIDGTPSLKRESFDVVFVS